MRRRITGAALCRNDAQSPFFCDLPPDRITDVSLVGDDGERWLLPVQKGTHHLAVMHVSARYCQTQGAALGIYSSVNFARAATS